MVVKKKVKRTKNQPKTSGWELSDIIGYDGSYPECESFDYETIKHVSEKAALFVIDGEEYWIPKSQVVELTKDFVTITSWLVGKLGW